MGDRRDNAPMRHERRAVYAALVSTLLSVLLAVAVNVGTGGELPGPVGGLAWLAWPLVGMLTGVTVWLAIRDARGPAAPAGTPSVAAPKPAVLPAADGYTGRAADVERLTGLVDAGRRAIVVAGPPGIGKSALATQVAHALAARYPDGQLVVSLGGGTGITADPVDVLRRLLDDLGAGVTGPADLDRLVARYRTTLAGRRVLLFLDDARDAPQVRPLLPGSPRCLTLVTSRSPLADLTQAVTYEVGVLTDADALSLLRNAGAGDRLDAEPHAAAEIVAACGALPLALQVAGARLRKRPAWTLADLAARLRDERARLDELYEGDLDVRASFTTAYDDLPDADRRAFRALGAYPGRDLPDGAAAALTGDPGAAERLVDARLVDAVAADRYRLHDLMRLFARERLAAEDPRATAARALSRLVDWYVATLPDAAADWIDAEVDNVALAVRAALDRHAPADALRLAVAADVPLLHRAEQRAFLQICRDRMRAAQALGDDRARDEALTRLGGTIVAYGHVDEGIGMLVTALDRWVARGDPDWIAFTRMTLGNALRDGGRNTEAIAQLEGALAHFAATGDRRREAQALAGLGVTYVNRHEPDEAIAVLERARAAAAEAGTHPQPGAWMLLNLATALHQAARYDEARPILEEAHRGFQDPLNWTGVGYSRLEYGDAADAAGDFATAAGHYDAAREAFARIDNRPGLAMTDQALGFHRARQGDPAAAAAMFARAAATFDGLGNGPSAGVNLLRRAEQLRAAGRRAEADADVARGEALLEGSDLPVARMVRHRLREG
jgi:tetratricopeptide (TPR) repeat protein